MAKLTLDVIQLVGEALPSTAAELVQLAVGRTTIGAGETVDHDLVDGSGLPCLSIGGGRNTGKAQGSRNGACQKR